MHKQLFLYAFSFHLVFIDAWLINFVFVLFILCQGWTKFYEFSLSDLRAGYDIIDRLFDGKSLLQVNQLLSLSQLIIFWVSLILDLNKVSRA